MEFRYARENNRQMSDAAVSALADLESLGYDVQALIRRNMEDDQIVELREKAYRFRGIAIPGTSSKAADDLASFFSLGIDLSLMTAPEQARILARHIFYLAEKQLSDT
jgi:hypothetical protein